jgi:hypothetical protein
MNKMMRGFFGMVEDLRKEFDEGAKGPGNVWTAIWFVLRLPLLRERLARR